MILDARPRFVTRAGAKLAAGLERFDLAVDDVRALDAGASGGGFTDCLLQHGARHVVAVDVGYGLLHAALPQDDGLRRDGQLLDVDEVVAEALRATR